MVYTIEERVEMVFIYAAENRCFTRAAAVFNERYPGKNVRHKYIRELVAKFQETGSVANKKRNEPYLLNEARQIQVLGQFAISPTMSLRKAAEETGLSRESVRKVLKLHKFHPYKLQITQELGDDDPDRRIEFCEIMTNRIIGQPQLIKNICFSDECTFYLNGKVNKQNCRYWSDINPHAIREGHTQYPQKINVWAGILGNAIIGPLFINENLNGEIYGELLDRGIEPLIIHEVENQRDVDGNLALDEQLLHFQQDGAPPHYVRPVREWLDNHYPEQWIGRRGPIEWPPRSPDLTPLDFFLWGHLKSVVFKTQPDSIEDLQQRIIQECRAISPETFQKVREQFELRLYMCLEKNGNHFEQFIK